MEDPVRPPGTRPPGTRSSDRAWPASGPSGESSPTPSSPRTAQRIREDWGGGGFSPGAEKQPEMIGKQVEAKRGVF